MKKLDKTEKIEKKSEHQKLLTFGVHGLNNGDLLAETAKACYVMARPILNSNALWYIPAAIFVMHHFLESFIKSFLIKEKITYKTGQSGHKLTYLLSLGKTNFKLGFFREILNNKKIIFLLDSLDSFYLKNKYFETGFSIRINSVINAFDQLISIFSNKFHLLYGNSKREPSIDVPEELVNLIEQNRKYATTLCVLPRR